MLFGEKVDETLGPKILLLGEFWGKAQARSRW